MRRPILINVVSRDGFSWQRPFRKTSDFQGVDFNLCAFFHPPINVNGEYRCVAGGEIHTMDPSRMFFAQCTTDTEVTTRVVHPTGNSLLLQVSFESTRLQQKSHLRQGYLFAELRTADDRPIPGFEKEKSRFLPSAETCLPLVWGGKSLPKAIPENGIRLMLYRKDMRIYSLSY